MIEIINDLKNFIEKYNNIYISNKVTSLSPINLKVPEEYEKKISEEYGTDKNLIFFISFSLKHKRIEWCLKKNEHNDEERSYYVYVRGFDLADDEYYNEKYFPSIGEAVDYIKNQIIKTYENFQNL